MKNKSNRHAKIKIKKQIHTRQLYETQIHNNSKTNNMLKIIQNK